MPNGSFLFVFTDGVGIGSDVLERNPFLGADVPTWRAMGGGTIPTLAQPAPRSGTHATIFGADATLGVAGLPQSGTGTTTLLTGVNAAHQLGRHDGPYPPAEVQPLLKAQNFLTQTVNVGGRAAFANAYPPFYFDRLARGKARRTTCTQAALGAGLSLRTYEDLIAGEALSGWIVNDLWRRMGDEIPLITAYEAGENLARLALTHDATLFEYFQTDHVGHRPDMAEAHATLALLDGFLSGIIGTLNPEQDLLIVAADHGNFEEQSHSDHTLNPSMVTVWGKGHQEVAAGIQTIADIVPQAWQWLSAR
jgi:2,3-bisphosphoglycerate-independent phosphoglycerate mutase